MFGGRVGMWLRRNEETRCRECGVRMRRRDVVDVGCCSRRCAAWWKFNDD